MALLGLSIERVGSNNGRLQFGIDAFFDGFDEWITGTTGKNIYRQRKKNVLKRGFSWY